MEAFSDCNQLLQHLLLDLPHWVSILRIFAKSFDLGHSSLDGRDLGRLFADGLLRFNLYDKDIFGSITA